jgi:hypothetical protein
MRVARHRGPPPLNRPLPAQSDHRRESGLTYGGEELTARVSWWLGLNFQAVRVFLRVAVLN